MLIREIIGMKQNKQNDIKIIGLTGGIGSGKSTVAKILQNDFGAKVIIADEIGYMAMNPGESSYYDIISYFGTAILNDKKEINRQELANIVFHDDDKLTMLNSIIHPYVHKYVLQVLEEVKKDKSADFVIIESAILIEAGYQSICDEIWYVSVEDKLRRERLIKNRGYSMDKIESIVKKQMKEADYKKYATKIITNNGDISEISRQLELLLV